jgi:hypothetical protein
MSAREKYEAMRAKLAAVKSAPRAKLYTAIPGVREAVELVDLAESLLGDLVNQVEKLSEVKNDGRIGKKEVGENNRHHDVLDVPA